MTPRADPRLCRLQSQAEPVEPKADRHGNRSSRRPTRIGPATSSSPPDCGNAEEYLTQPGRALGAPADAAAGRHLPVALDVQPDRIVAETKFAGGLPLAEDMFRLYERACSAAGRSAVACTE